MMETETCVGSWINESLSTDNFGKWVNREAASWQLFPLQTIIKTTLHNAVELMLASQRTK